MTKPKPPISIERLLNSALAADAMMGPGFRRVTRPQAVFVSTGGKTKEQIMRDVAAAMRRAGLLKE